MIPKIIHQIWLQGYNQIPKQLLIYHKNCHIVNDGFKHILWDEPKIKLLLENNFGKKYIETFNKYECLAQKADFARYAILYTYGGIYLDMDMICRKNLEPFLKHNFFFTKFSVPLFISKRYNNAVFGSIPKHPIYPIAFQKMFERLSKKSNITYSTGTKLFYDAITTYQKKTGMNDAVLIDQKYLHPCDIYDDDTCPYTCTDCFVSHVGYGSWGGKLQKFTNKYLVKNIKVILFIIVIIIFTILLFLKR